MSHDGLAERTAILAHVQEKGGGLFVKSLQDAAEISKGAKPFGVVTFGQPTPLGKLRTLADGAADLPYRMRFMVQCLALDPDDAEALDRAVRLHLVGWTPDVVGADEVEAVGGTVLPSEIEFAERPSLFRVTSRYSIAFNL